MVAVVASNPLATTVSQGTFNVTSVGLVQGTAYPDPNVHFKLAGGYLASTETIPMWGGVGIFTDVPGATGTPSSTMGPAVGRATTLANLVAFSVFDQAYAMLNSPQNPVPQTPSYGQVNYYRLGSGARIAVATSAALVSLQGGLTTAQVSWDFVNQQLIPYQATYTSASVLSATYTSSTGILAVTFSAAPAGATPTVGAYFSLSGLTTSAGSASNVNGDFPLVSSASAGTVLNLQAVAGLGTITINGSTGTLAAGGGALACQVLEIQTTNCQTVVPGTGSYAGGYVWNFNGSAALILI